MGEVGIKLRKNESFNRAFKRFKKVFERGAVIRNYKKALYYEKPSEKRKKRKYQIERERERARRLNKKKK